jgi:murein tripeptide amidase MpaA
LNLLANGGDKRYKIFDYEILTQSLGGVDIPLITITNEVGSKSSKQYMIVAARVHAGETNSSYVVHGLIKFLLSTSIIARMLRDKFIFKIIPMINPDGVIVGNNRASFIGKDLNRTYLDPN